MIRKWISNDQLTINEPVGDTVAVFDKKLAEDIYTMCGSKKAMQMKLSRGEYDPQMFNAKPDELLNQLKTMVATDPQGALAFAEALSKSNKLSFSSMAECFLNNNAIPQLTSFALNCMPDNPDMDNWQTLILELNLKHNPSIVETIF